MIKIDTQQKNGFDNRQWVRFVNSLSGSKSANLVGTVSESGHINLSIISSFFHLGANPPLIGFILRPNAQDSPGHTFANIKATKVFTINHVNSVIFKKAHQASARYDKNVSEFKEVGLTQEHRESFLAPFVKESNIQIACELLEMTEIKHNNTHLVISRINSAYLEGKHLRQDGSIDVSAADTVSVTGLDEYHSLKPLSRLSYAKTGKPVEEI